MKSSCCFINFWIILCQILNLKSKHEKEKPLQMLEDS